MLPEFINCDNHNISFDSILKSLMTIDTNGNTGIRAIHSADSEVPYYNCDNASTPFENAFLKSVVLVNGLPTLNLAIITPAP